MSDWRDFCSDWWLEKADRLEAEWADGIPTNWFATRTVWDCGLFSMDAGHAAAQLAEMPEGFVSLAGPSPTPTDVNHLYHLWMAGLPSLPAGTVVEWGGGYGNTARLIQNLLGAVDHVIVDIPIMCCLQHHYLRTKGNARWNVDSVSIPDVSKVLYGPVPLFLAAFSLDECSTAAHDFVFDADWFGASTVLIVAQTEGKDDMFPDGRSLVARLRAAGFVETPAMQDNASYFWLVR